MLRPMVAAGLLPLAMLVPTGDTMSRPTSTPPAPPTASASKPAAVEPRGRTCADVVAGLSLSEQVGQTIMVAQSATRPSPAGQQVIHRLHLGSVVLLGNSTLGRARTAALVDGLRDGAGTTDGVGLLLAADQEGGLVQRLKGSGFSTIPSARDQAGWSDRTLRRRSTTWSKQLGRAGIDLNLAPVADVVPASVGSANEPIGALHRGYGPHPGVVARKTTAVVEGMHAGGTATTTKHFPGLGRVRGNTDTTAKVVDPRTTRHDRLLAGFRADVEHGTDVVMVSSATYRRIDAKHPATYSSTVVDQMLRHDLGFRGVVVSDDLLGRALASTAVRSRGVRFLGAGGDLALVGDTSAAAEVHAGLLDRARSDTALRARVQQSATRVVELKSRQGRASCRVTA
ncbi:MAG TPA: glycoside hydrolase family 3 N-terminal domain-containing protein [Friedmanniella sp.]